MNGIGWAVKEMQNGERVRRAGWNGKGMFLFLVPRGYTNHPAVSSNADSAPYVALWSAQAEVIPWNCSQADLLAVDWELAYR